jgi:hypothetical protein
VAVVAGLPLPLTTVTAVLLLFVVLHRALLT